MMIIRASIYNLILVAVLSLFTVDHSMAAVIGKVTSVNGRVDILNPGQDSAVPLEAGAPVSTNDLVRTKSNSRAEITMLDGTVIRLAEGTRIGIIAYRLDGDGRLKECTLELLRGKIRTISTGAVSGFQVLTPNAKADNIDGTDFYFIYEKGNSLFYGSGGTLRASSKEDPGRAVSIRRRSCVKVADGMPLEDSCAFNDIDEQKYSWDTSVKEEGPVVAQLPSEGEVYTYTPLGGKAVDTPSMPVPIPFDDLTCTQCPIVNVPLIAEPASTPPPVPPTINIKMGDFERIDNGCCNPVPPIIPVD